MRFWETVTGGDLTREWAAFEARAAALPAGHRAAWEEIKSNLFAYGDFTGRNLTPILDAALTLLEESDGRSVREVLGDDVPGFCTALARGAGARTARDRRRARVNSKVARRLRRLS